MGRVCDFNDLHLPPLCTVFQVVKTSERVEGDIARDIGLSVEEPKMVSLRFRKDDTQAKLTFQSAFSGEALHSILVSELNPCRNFVGEGRRLLSAQLGHPPLAISLLLDGEPLALDLTWQDLGKAFRGGSVGATTSEKPGKNLDARKSKQMMHQRSWHASRGANAQTPDIPQGGLH